jgi:hypothetical protein
VTRPTAIKIGVLCTFLVVGCTAGRDEPTLDNPFDPRNSEDFPIPDSVVVTVGNNFVRLDWALDNVADFDEYAVFRKRLDTVTDSGEELAGRVPTRFFEDRSVRNGRVYQYQIAAGKDGRFGERSEDVEARPGLFAITIANDAPKTPDRNVGISLSSPGLVNAIQLSEDPDFAGAPWRDVAETALWILSNGDGEKLVYGSFRLADGSESVRVMDSIILDTQAIIRSVEFTGSDVRAPGDIIHFRLDAGEKWGAATIVVDGLLTNVLLLDDGPAGMLWPTTGSMSATWRSRPERWLLRQL